MAQQAAQFKAAAAAAAGGITRHLPEPAPEAHLHRHQADMEFPDPSPSTLGLYFIPTHSLTIPLTVTWNSFEVCNEGSYICNKFDHKMEHLPLGRQLLIKPPIGSHHQNRGARLGALHVRLRLRMMDLVFPLLFAAMVALLVANVRLRRLVRLVMRGMRMLRHSLSRPLAPRAHLGTHSTQRPETSRTPSVCAARGRRGVVGVVGAKLHHHGSALLRMVHGHQNLGSWRGKTGTLQHLGSWRRRLYMELLLLLQARLGERGVAPGRSPAHVHPHLRSPRSWRPRHVLHIPTTRWRGAVRVALLLIRHDGLWYPRAHRADTVRVPKIGVRWTARRMPGSNVVSSDDRVLRVTEVPRGGTVLREMASRYHVVTLGARGPC